MRKLALLAVSTSIFLVACTVDTTGVSTESKKTARGNLSASVTVTEYGDFQCPACKSAETAVVEPLMAKYGTRIRFVFNHFPIRSLHPFALAAAEASECAADQGKFWEYHDLAYAEQDQLSTAQLRTWAKNLSLDTDLFERCLKSGIKRDIVMNEYDAGTALDVRGTPTFFVNGTQVQSSVDALSAAIDAALAQGRMPL